MTIPRNISIAALTAKAIRQQLKAAGIPARVTSENFSGGNAVNVTLTADPLPATLDAVSRALSCYEYGSFDAMTDCHQYTNKRSDVPQVKYLSISTEYSPAMHQAAWDYVRRHFAGWDHCPERYSDLDHTHSCRADNNNDWALNVVLRVLLGQYHPHVTPSFWSSMKPRQRAA